ncbi:hypothetical protein EVAR_16262_1 [Eumeta japonica]|uniref:Uncharacterized protein n=1 Tax=Eumeta variegata TaxID=151549 RepID=A0A4C1U5T2_EUMVA|nr:hypothetical protein EVAR_16262_1 [Eumeta japonica]
MSEEKPPAPFTPEIDSPSTVETRFIPLTFVSARLHGCRDPRELRGRPQNNSRRRSGHAVFTAESVRPAVVSDRGL